MQKLIQGLILAQMMDQTTKLSMTVQAQVNQRLTPSLQKKISFKPFK